MSLLKTRSKSGDAKLRN